MTQFEEDFELELSIDTILLMEMRISKLHRIVKLNPCIPNWFEIIYPI